MGRLGDNRSGVRRYLSGSGHRVNFLDPVALLGQNFILVGAAGFDARNEELPDASCTHHAHRVRDAAPVGE